MLGFVERIAGGVVSLDKSPLLCYSVGMKKAIIITAILALVAGAGGAIWLSIYFEQQNAVGAAQEQPQSNPEPEPSKYDVGPPDPQELLELVNEERRRVGVPPLQYDANVAKSAQLKADDMAARGYRQHEIPGVGNTYTPEMHQLLFGDAQCAVISENLVWDGDNDELTSRRAFNWWMKSTPHREALQSAGYNRVGFGTTKSLAVQHFCKNR